MTIVLTEWALDPNDAPRTARELLESCADGTPARVVRAYLARSREHAVVLFDAADVDALARSLERGGRGPTLLYPVHAVVHQPHPDKPGYSIIVVQRELPSTMSLEDVRYAASDPKGCNGRNRLTHAGAFFSEQGVNLCCMYTGPDVESVRIANRESGVPWRNMWVAELYEGPGRELLA